MRRTILSFLFLMCAHFAHSSEVAIIASETGYLTSVAKHAERWLKQEGVSSDFYGSKDLEKALGKSKIIFLVGFSEFSKQELSAIRGYFGRGGKLVVFHSSSDSLATMMGVKQLGYKKADYPGKWSRMDFNSKLLSGCPGAILQTSSVLKRAEAIQGKSKVLSTWSDRNGRSTGDAAWILSPHGFWMTHVLTADGDETLKTQLVAAMVGNTLPSLWNASAAEKRRRFEDAATRKFASAQRPKKGEIRAVWDHTGCGLYPGNWSKTIRTLKARGVTDLFLNVAGAGFAHYPSKVLPQSKTFRDEGDQLAAAILAAKGTGIRIHVWMLCFNTSRAPDDKMAFFRKNGWLLKDKDGKDTAYLDPANPAVRKYLFSAMDEVLRNYNVAGVHLDYVRYFEKSVKPKNAPDIISKFVADSRLHVRRPLWLTTAVFGKYPACVKWVGQDWSGWVDSNIVDYVVPMDYTENTEKFEGFLQQHSAKRGNAERTIVGIGVTANESRLSAVQVINQILLARRYRCAGVALFDLDTTLEKRILPYLSLGLWK